MSLGDALTDPADPFRAFLSFRLPLVRAVAIEESEPLAVLPTLRPGPEAPHRILAKGVLYRVRFDLASPPVRRLPAWRDALRIGLRTGNKNMAALEDLFERLESYLTGIEPVGRRLTLRNEEQLNRFCLALAKLEDLGEGRPGQEEEDFFERLRQGTLLESFPRDWVTDVRAVCRSFHAQRYLLLDEPVDLTPRFSGDDLAGADEDDLLVGQRLVAVQSTVHPEIRETWLMRLVGRALLDLDDAHEIRELGLYLSRQGKMLRWGLEELLLRLGCTAGLAELRFELRAHLENPAAQPIPITRATGEKKKAPRYFKKPKIPADPHPDQLRFSFG